MQSHKHNWLLKLFLWLLVEIALNALGLDELADYSEFLTYHTIAPQWRDAQAL